MRWLLGPSSALHRFSIAIHAPRRVAASAHAICVHFSWQLWAPGYAYSDMCDGPPRQPARVLLLEDDAAFSAILVEFLAGEGFDVAACDSYTSLREALDAANRPIVVADFWGASQATLSACERDQIRELGGFTPTVLLTARAWASAASADELNVACILPKPVDLDELVARVLRCLHSGLDRE
jgi:DNA-binding NtrC family response regulator